MRVLIAGCGWLGRTIAARLSERGDGVVAIVRTEASAARLRADGIAAEARDLAADDAVLPAHDAIVTAHAAAGHGEEAYRRAYVEATATLLRSAAGRGTRLVYVSSTGVFGRRDGAWVDETSRPDPVGPTQRVLLEAEVSVTTGAGIVVRCSGLYGPERFGTVDRVRSGALALGPGDETWMNFCHREDAAAIVLGALDRGRRGGIYHASDATPGTRREVVTWIASRLGIEAPRASEGSAPAGRANRRIASEATRDELGVTLRFPSFREGLAEAFGGD
jgi:nucleoside-diphosphate-sugar epimerase